MNPELGLGRVIEVGARRVKLSFPAVDDERLYALPDPPLTRLMLEPGDSFEDRQGRGWRVIQVQQREAQFHYKCQDKQGAEQWLCETQVSPFLQLNRPREKFLSGRLDDNLWFELRLSSWKRIQQQAMSPVLGLCGPRIDLIPHQLFVAHQAARQVFPRVLLADEVGLGKTIEAGLILHQLLLAERVERVLILVPDSLLHQWLVEMLRRFNLTFSLFDGKRFSQAGPGNPFSTAQRVLCSIDFLLSEPRIARAVLEEQWDMLIVDEAHHLNWTQQESSLEYDLVEALAEQALSVLLLSATPEQLGREGHFGRLRLLDPHRYCDYERFVKEETQYQQIAELAAVLIEGQPLTADQNSLLQELLGPDAQADPDRVVRRMMDRHGLGRAVFRNTRRRIKGFPRRQLVVEELPFPSAWKETIQGIDALAPESKLSDWPRLDPRLPWLARKIRDLHPQKLLLICTAQSTVLKIQEWLRREQGIHAAVFHEGMEIVERDRAAEYFADPEQGSPILLCSEIGSEGRNFQFVRHLLLFDLPLEPELLEQRIGRLDRIGQGAVIHLHLPLLQSEAVRVLFQVYHQGMNLFEQPSATATALMEEFGEQLKLALRQPNRREALLQRMQRRRKQMEAELARGRDRLLEWQSCDPESAQALARQIETLDCDPQLQAYMQRYWDGWGVECEAGPGRSLVLHPGEHMREERFPELPEEGATVTFSRPDALVHEDRLFLTWEHPMVRGTMEQLTTGDLGSSVFVVLESGSLPSGTLLLELIYVVSSMAARELEAQRYLPPTVIRLLLDRNGKDYADLLPTEHIRGKSLHRDRHIAASVIKSQSSQIRSLLQQGESMAEVRRQQVVEQAILRMQADLGEESRRMMALDRIDGQPDLERLAQRRQLLEQNLTHSRLRLDALRLIIRT